MRELMEGRGFRARLTSSKINTLALFYASQWSDRCRLSTQWKVVFLSPDA